jgi:hypothetical protein
MFVALINIVIDQASYKEPGREIETLRTVQERKETSFFSIPKTGEEQDSRRKRRIANSARLQAEKLRVEPSIVYM